MKTLFNLLILFVILFLAIVKGAVPIDLLHLTPVQKDILLSVRIPRIILSAEIGSALVIAGTLFQYVLQNPLADSFTTGASSASALGAVIAIALGLTQLLLPFSLAFALLSLAVVYKLASFKGKLSPVTVLLAGIIISTFSSATISFIKFLSQDSVTSIVFWLMGSFQNASYTKDFILFAILIPVLIRLYKLSLAIDILSFDEQTAMSSGVNVYLLRKELLFHGALLTAVCVAFSGIIGFVGLIVPHILRFFKHYQAKSLFIQGTIAGASFMMLADLLSRVLLKGGEELPVGVLTSTIGGIFFLYVLMQRKKEFYQWEP